MRPHWALTLALFCSLALSSAFASNTTALHLFKGTPDGDMPRSLLTEDAQGNLYGTTYYGGTSNVGTVYELKSNGKGAYSYSVIYSFQYAAGDAENPDSSPLFVDKAGNIYGTTMFGGNQGGLGAVYELSPLAGGGWSEKVICSFSESFTDGFYPMGGVIMDSAGNLYGATENGGSHDVGTVFELSPNGNGGWNLTTLYAFTGNRNSGPDGAGPLAGVAFDAAGNLYGTTFLGGEFLDGIVYELSPTQSGTWKETILHAFNGNDDGCNPESRVLVDSAGNVYGSTFSLGGVTSTCAGAGTVFELSPSASGWNETVLHQFPFSVQDGNYPNGITFDSMGNIYGTTYLGTKYGYGEVFRLTPSSTGTWQEAQLHLFIGGSGGGWPLSGVVVGSDGNLYGTVSAFGGKNGNAHGAVFKMAP